MKKEWGILLFILVAVIALGGLYLLTIGPKPFLYHPTDTYHFPPDRTQYPDRRIPQIQKEEEPAQERILRKAPPEEGILPYN